ncbi:MAG: TauD/TfdA family dioxygenase, partial [Acidimicrobiales bacterium]
TVETWRGEGALVAFEFGTLSQNSVAHLELLELVAKSGAAKVVGAGTDEAATVALAGLFGHIRETDFGRLFDIVFEGDAWTKSQTSDALDPHTDDPYRYTPSGASVLHCVESTAEGGDSILVDGFAVAADLRHRSSEMFEILSTTAVPFIRHRGSVVDQGEDVHLIAKAPIIAVDGNGAVCGVRFHERSMGVLDLDPDTMGDYYRALIRFTSMVTDADYSTTIRLEPGDALLFDNQRVLHGRTAFDGRVGRRHIRLCTVDRDQFHSRLRRLRETHERTGIDSWLPAGNLS